MFRILLVEDDIDTLRMLERKISEEVIGAVVHVAETVPDANELINRMENIRDSYSCAVLDFNLPLGDGTKKPDTSLCLRLQATMRGIGILHITSADKASRSILTHMSDYHSLQASDLVYKDDIDWPSKTCDKLRNFLYSQHIEHRIDMLFSTGPDGAEYARGATSALQDLERDAAQMWPHLALRARERLRRRFVINDEDERIKIWLK